ncbi:MAG: TonB-dependent receptor [Prolixibacteraceae bacterium]|jgi:TonB-linked SusC/RagA family outer membrane protein|nr:TonB-dependent receptor [Prolixibacteraceae bacterium]
MKQLLLIIGCILIAGQLFAQVNVSGRVDDEAGEGIPGVTVVVKGTTNGSITDMDGMYTIGVENPQKDLLVFSFVGMKTQEIPVNGKTTINATLESGTEYLDEVVAIGYGSVQKKDLTGSVASVGEEQLKDIPLSSTAQALTGRLAGVQITTSEGSPDAEIKIRVRGGGSITQDNSPLYIVDGFPVSSISDVAPSDIKSIDVLKDASSTAIYGSRGANGVIIITTKSGEKGKVTVSFNSYLGQKTLANRLNVLDPKEYVLFQYERSRGSFPERKDFEFMYGPWEEIDTNYGTSVDPDWQGQVFGADAPTYYNNLSISGGDEKTKYSVSYTNTTDKSIMVETGFKKNNFSTKFQHKANDFLTLDFNLKYSDRVVFGAGTSNAGTSSSNSLRHSVQYRPTKGLADSDETLVFDDDEYYIASQLTDPLTLALDDYKQNFRTTNNYNASITLDPLKGLILKSSVGMEKRNERLERFYGLTTSTARRYGDKPVVNLEMKEKSTFRITNTANYNLKKVAGQHDINILIGQEAIKYTYNSFSIESRSFPKDITPEIAIGSMTLGDEEQKPQTYEIENALLSYFARVNYSWRDKLLTTITYRVDGSSRFSPLKRYGNFPSASVAYRLSEEPFIQNIPSISNLKVRASFGTAGNNRIDDYLWMTTYSVSSSKAYFLNESEQPYMYPTTLSNPDLMWETTITRNLGIDLGLFNSRINSSIELYYNSTVDLLIPLKVPSVSGFESQWQNIGSTSNRGVELNIDAVIVETNDFSFQANFNISFNKNRVDDLGGLDYFTQESGWSSDTGDDYIVKIGESIGLMYGFVTDGFYAVDDFVLDDAGAFARDENGGYILQPNVADNRGITFAGFGPGSYKFQNLASPVDESGTVIDDGSLVTFDDDRTVIGDANPDHFGGMNLMASYKSFDCSVFLNWVYGNDIYNASKIEFSSAYRKYTNMLSDVNSNERWMTVNELGEVVTDPSDLAALNANATTWTPPQGRYLFHSWAVEDGSFLRVNNITLGYTLPKQLLNKVKIQNLRIYGTINNVHTFTKYSGFDPEVDTRRKTPMTPGVDFSAFPRSRSVIFGLNLTL